MTMSNNPSFSMNNFLYLHEGIHGNYGDVHQQYYSSFYPRKIGNQVSTNANQWIKAYSIQISAANSGWGDAYVILNVSNASVNATPVYYRVYLKVRYNSNVSQLVDFHVENGSLSNVMAVVSENDSTYYTVDLYLQNTLSYGNFDVRELGRGFLGNTQIITWNGNTNWVTSLPAGTQYAPTYFPIYSNIDTRYVQRTPYSTQNSGATANQWALIGTTTISAQYYESIAFINIMGGAGGNNNNTQRGVVYFRVKQQAVLGSAPYVEIQLMNNTNFNATDVTAVLTTNSSSQTVVQLYVKINSTYEQLWYSPFHDPYTGVSGLVGVSWSNQATLVSSLPSGTQYTATAVSGAYGSATINASATTATVTHGLGYAPTFVNCTPQGNVGSVWVTNITTTQFTINCSTAPASNTTVSYHAK